MKIASRLRQYLAHQGYCDVAGSIAWSRRQPALLQ